MGESRCLVIRAIASNLPKIRLLEYFFGAALARVNPKLSSWRPEEAVATDRMVSNLL